MEKISVSKNDSNENNKSTDEILVENGQKADKIHDSEITGEEENVAENHINAKSDNDEKDENKTDENLDKVQYSLSAVVCYIDDKTNEDRRNIVALLRVGPNYHERSAGSAVSQWYIFNDFWYVNIIRFLY